MLYRSSKLTGSFPKNVMPFSFEFKLETRKFTFTQTHFWRPKCDRILGFGIFFEIKMNCLQNAVSLSKSAQPIPKTLCYSRLNSNSSFSKLVHMYFYVDPIFYTKTRTDSWFRSFPRNKNELATKCAIARQNRTSLSPKAYANLISVHCIQTPGGFVYIFRHGILAL